MAAMRRVVLPGEDVTRDVENAAPVLRIGNGLFSCDDSVVVSKAGELSFKAPNRFFVQSSGKRYSAAVGDTVVGIVVDRTTEFYKVNINGGSSALLSMLAFDGASKRNKPNLQAGSVVFARVAACSKFMEPELSCQTVSGPKKDWMTGQSLFGELRGGTLVNVSLALARRLLHPRCVVLGELGKAWPFEVAVGVNGTVWLQAATVTHTVAISTAITRSEFLTDAQVPALVSRLVAAAQQADRA